MLNPLFSEISNSKSVLLAGAGGGFDFVSGIPIYLYLRKMGIEITLANLSFTQLPFSEAQEVFPGTYHITENCTDLPYFPEKYVLEWLQARGENPSVYALSNDMGVQPLRRAYAHIQSRHAIDTLILVDGGTDSLMFGDESKVGTIVEDACSIVAANQLPIANSYLLAIGFGVEHELNHHACLENIAALTQTDEYLGAFSLTKAMPEGQAYLELVQYLNEKMRLHESIVTNSIASAMQGGFGDLPPTRRSKSSTQFISPLMNLYWSFRLQGLAARIQFAQLIEDTTTMHEVAKIFQKYRAMNTRRAHQTIPLL